MRKIGILLLTMILGGFFSLPLVHAANPSKVKFQLNKVDEFGISFLSPVSWRLITDTGSSLLFKGRVNEPLADLTVNIRIIKTEKKAKADLGQRMLELEKQFTKAPLGKVVKKSVTMVAGEKAPYLLAGYKAMNYMGKSKIFAHAQIGFTHKELIILISYAAPVRVYKENLPNFQRLVDSFRFS